MKKNMMAVLVLAALAMSLLWCGTATAEEQYPLGQRTYCSYTEIDVSNPGRLTPAQLADWADDFEDSVCYGALQSALDLATMVRLIDDNDRINGTPEINALYARYDSALRGEASQRVDEAQALYSRIDFFASQLGQFCDEVEDYNDAIIGGEYANGSDEMDEIRAMRDIAVEDGLAIAEALRKQMADLKDQAANCQNALASDDPDSLTAQIRTLAQPILLKMYDAMEKKERENTAFGKPPVITVISDLQFALTALDGEGFQQKRLKDVEITVSCWDDPKKTKTVKTDEHGKAILFAADFMPNDEGVMFLHVVYDARKATYNGQLSDHGVRDLGCLILDRGSVFNLQMTDSPIYLSKVVYNDMWDMLSVDNGVFIHPDYDHLNTITMDVAQNGQPVRVTGYYPDANGGIGEKVFTIDLKKPSDPDIKALTHCEIRQPFAQMGKPGAFRPKERMRFRVEPLVSGENDAALDFLGMFTNAKAYWAYDKGVNGEPLSDTKSFADKIFGSSGFAFPGDLPVVGGLTCTFPAFEIFEKTQLFVKLQPDGSLHVTTSTRYFEEEQKKLHWPVNEKNTAMKQFEKGIEGVKKNDAKSLAQIGKGISPESGTFVPGKWMKSLDISTNLYWDFHATPDEKTHSIFFGVNVGFSFVVSANIVKQFFPGGIPLFVSFGVVSSAGIEVSNLGFQGFFSDSVPRPIRLRYVFTCFDYKDVKWFDSFNIKFPLHLEFSAAAGVGVPGIASVSLNFAAWFDLVVPFCTISKTSYEVGCKLYAKLEFLIFFSKNFCLAHAVHTHPKNQLTDVTAGNDLPVGKIETITYDDARKLKDNILPFSPADTQEQQWIKSLPTDTTDVRFFKTASSYFAFWTGMRNGRKEQVVMYSQYVYNPDSYYDHYVPSWTGNNNKREDRPAKGTVLMGVAACDISPIRDYQRSVLSYDVCFAGDLCAIAVSYGHVLENSQETDLYARMYQQQERGRTYIFLYDREMRPTLRHYNFDNPIWGSPTRRYLYSESAVYIGLFPDEALLYDLHLQIPLTQYETYYPMDNKRSVFCLTGMRLEKENGGDYSINYYSHLAEQKTSYGSSASGGGFSSWVVYTTQDIAGNRKIWSGRASQYSKVASVPLPIYPGGNGEYAPVVLFSVRKKTQNSADETEKNGLTLMLAHSPANCADISFTDRDKGTEEIFTGLGSMMTDGNGAAFVLENLQKAPTPKTPDEKTHAKTKVSILTIRRGDNWRQICDGVVLKTVDLPAADGAHVMSAYLNGNKLNYLYWIEAGSKNTAPAGQKPVIEPNYKIRAMVYDIGQCIFTPPFTMLTMKGTANGLRLMDAHGQNDTLQAIYMQPGEEESKTTPGLVNVKKVSVAVQNFKLGYSVAIRDFTTEFPVVRPGQQFKLFFRLENTGVFVVNKVGLHVDGLKNGVAYPLADYCIDLTKPDQSTARLLHADGGETKLQGPDAIFRSGGLNDFVNHPYNILTTFSSAGNGGTIIPKTDKRTNRLPGFLPGNIHVYATNAVPTPEKWSGDYTLRATVATYGFCLGVNPDDPDMCFTAVRRENGNGAADYVLYRASDVVDGVPVANAAPVNDQFALMGFVAPAAEAPLNGQDSAANLNALLPDATQRFCDIRYNGVTLTADLARYNDEDYAEFTVSNDAGVDTPKVKAEIQVELMNESNEYRKIGAFPLADQDIKDGMHVTLSSSLKHLANGQRFEKMRLTVVPQDKANGYSDIYEQGYSTELDAPIQYHFTRQTQAESTMDGKGITLSVQGMGEQPENAYRYYWMRYSPALGSIMQLNTDAQSSPRFTVEMVRAKQDPNAVYWCVVTDQNGYQISSDPITPELNDIPPIPKTGDTASPALWAGLALVSLALTAILLRRRKVREE